MIKADHLGLGRLELLDTIEKSLIQSNIEDIDINSIEESIKFIEEHLNLKTDVDKFYSLKYRSNFTGHILDYARLSYFGLYSKVLDCFVRDDTILEIRECS